MSKPSKSPVAGLRKPNRYVVWSTPAISRPRCWIWAMVEPGEIVELGERLPVTQLFEDGLPPLVSAPATLAGVGSVNVPTGAGSTGEPALPHAVASNASAARKAGSRERLCIFRGLATS